MSLKANIKRAVNAAIAAHLATFDELAGVQIVKALDSEEQNSTRIRVSCSARHMIAGMYPGANYTVDAVVSVVTPEGLSDMTAHHLLDDAVQAILEADGLAAALTATAQGVVVDVATFGEVSDEVQEENRISTTTIELEARISA